MGKTINMKLITEHYINTVKYLIEENKETKSKDYYLVGIFMQAQEPNRNNRVYPVEVINREVNNYNKNYINEGRAMGELGHPDTPVVNLERVSHLVKELSLKGTNVYGKAKLMDTPMGNIAKKFVDEGVKLGVSSRGLGSLREERDGIKVVQDDFQLNAIDIVADPSAPQAFVEGILENKEWIYENGIIKEKQIDTYKKIINKHTNENIEKKFFMVFTDFIQKLKNKN